jgi:hypothetical protein
MDVIFMYCKGTSNMHTALELSPSVLEKTYPKCIIPPCCVFIFFHVFFLAQQDQIHYCEHRIAVGYRFDMRQIPPLSKGK